MEEEETTKHLFSKQEVAQILARFIESATGKLIVNPRLVIGNYDILLVSDVVD